MSRHTLVITPLGEDYTGIRKFSFLFLFSRVFFVKGAAPSVRRADETEVGALDRAVRSSGRPTRGCPPDIRAPLFHSPCRCRVDSGVIADKWASSQRSSSCCQSSELIGRHRRPTACATARSDSSRARSGRSACVTAVHTPRRQKVPQEGSARSQRRLRGRNRRTADQAHRGRCPADPPRPWGRMVSAWGALN